MSNMYKFSANMTCSSCSNCITKVLEKNKSKGVGISSYDVDLPNKLVTVTGTVAQAEITEILSKTGVEVSLLEVVPQAEQ